LEILPIIIGLVAFLFSSIFDSSKKQQGPKQKRAPAPKPVKPEVKRVSPVMTVPEKPKKVEKKTEKPLSELERLQRENASLQKKIKMMEQQRNRGAQVPIPNKEDNADSDGFFTKDNIIQAVVFSEVLASPRARNPHRASIQRKVKNLE